MAEQIPKHILEKAKVLYISPDDVGEKTIEQATKKGEDKERPSEIEKQGLMVSDIDLQNSGLTKENIMSLVTEREEELTASTSRGKKKVLLLLSYEEGEDDVKLSSETEREHKQPIIEKTKLPTHLEHKPILHPTSPTAGTVIHEETTQPIPLRVDLKGTSPVSLENVDLSPTRDTHTAEGKSRSKTKIFSKEFFRSPLRRPSLERRHDKSQEMKEVTPPLKIDSRESSPSVVTKFVTPSGEKTTQEEIQIEEHSPSILEPKSSPTKSKKYIFHPAAKKRTIETELTPIPEPPDSREPSPAVITTKSISVTGEEKEIDQPVMKQKSSDSSSKRSYIFSPTAIKKRSIDDRTKPVAELPVLSTKSVKVEGKGDDETDTSPVRMKKKFSFSPVSKKHRTELTADKRKRVPSSSPPDSRDISPPVVSSKNVSFNVAQTELPKKSPSLKSHSSPVVSKKLSFSPLSRKQAHEKQSELEVPTSESKETSPTIMKSVFVTVAPKGTQKTTRKVKLIKTDTNPVYSKQVTLSSPMTETLSKESIEQVPIPEPPAVSREPSPAVITTKSIYVTGEEKEIDQPVMKQKSSHSSSKRSYIFSPTAIKKRSIADHTKPVAELPVLSTGDDETDTSPVRMKKKFSFSPVSKKHGTELTADKREHVPSSSPPDSRGISPPVVSSKNVSLTQERKDVVENVQKQALEKKKSTEHDSSPSRLRKYISINPVAKKRVTSGECEFNDKKLEETNQAITYQTPSTEMPPMFKPGSKKTSPLVTKKDYPSHVIATQRVEAKETSPVIPRRDYGSPVAERATQTLPSTEMNQMLIFKPGSKESSPVIPRKDYGSPVAERATARLISAEMTQMPPILKPSSKEASPVIPRKNYGSPVADRATQTILSAEVPLMFKPGSRDSSPIIPRKVYGSPVTERDTPRMISGEVKQTPLTFTPGLKETNPVIPRKDYGSPVKGAVAMPRLTSAEVKQTPPTFKPCSKDTSPVIPRKDYSLIAGDVTTPRAEVKQTPLTFSRGLKETSPVIPRKDYGSPVRGAVAMPRLTSAEVKQTPPSFKHGSKDTSPVIPRKDYSLIAGDVTTPRAEVKQTPLTFSPGLKETSPVIPRKDYGSPVRGAVAMPRLTSAEVKQTPSPSFKHGSKDTSPVIPRKDYSLIAGDVATPRAEVKQTPLTFSPGLKETSPVIPRKDYGSPVTGVVAMPRTEMKQTPPTLKTDSKETSPLVTKKDYGNPVVATLDVSPVQRQLPSPSTETSSMTAKKGGVVIPLSEKGPQPALTKKDSSGSKALPHKKKMTEQPYHELDPERAQLISTPRLQSMPTVKGQGTGGNTRTGFKAPSCNWKLILFIIAIVVVVLILLALIIAVIVLAVFLSKKSSSSCPTCMPIELCGSVGGWRRLAYLDMSDSTMNCPSGFRLYQSGGVRACGRNATASCQPVKFSSDDIGYSQVCGRVVGYQYGSPDALGSDYNDDNLNDTYINGISITRGASRQHVWSFLAGLNKNVTMTTSNCPCLISSDQSDYNLTLIGDNYFCSSGNPNANWEPVLYTADPLWSSCDEENCCSSASNFPWFHVEYNTNTTDYIELRVCGDQGTTDEDVPVSFYEIFVK